MQTVKILVWPLVCSLSVLNQSGTTSKLLLAKQLTKKVKSKQSICYSSPPTRFG